MDTTRDHSGRQGGYKILAVFERNNDISFVKIPTNGLTPDLIEETTRGILSGSSDIRLDVNLSLDGFSDTHDTIRDVSGNYEKALDILELLEELKENYERLCVYVNSVITSENIDELPDLGTHLFQNYDLDGHYFQIIRGDPMDPSLDRVPTETLRQFYRWAVQLNKSYVRREARRRGFKPRVLWANLRTRGYSFVYETQFNSYVYGEPWSMPCTAGERSLTIDFNGDVRICELREPVGNLREHDMDFRSLVTGKKWSEKIAKKYSDQCWDTCTHVCFMYDSIVSNPKTLLLDIPKTSAKGDWLYRPERDHEVATQQQDPLKIIQ